MPPATVVAACLFAAALIAGPPRAMAAAAAAAELPLGVSGGANNVAVGVGAVAVGGSRNLALQDYSTAGGGLRNKVFANYGTTVGGSSNNAVGRFSVVAGSAQSVADGRKSATLGFNATVHGDHSAAFAFNAGRGCDVARGEDNTIRFCADDLLYNDVSIKDLQLAVARRGLWVGTTDEAPSHGQQASSGGGDGDRWSEAAETLEGREAALQRRMAELDAFDARMEEELQRRERLIASNARALAGRQHGGATAGGSGGG